MASLHVSFILLSLGALCHCASGITTKGPRQNDYRPAGPPIPRDTYPTDCYLMLSPRRPGPLVSIARRRYCSATNNKCACSCHEGCRRRHERIQKCCIAKGVTRDCLHFCRYEMDAVEFGCQAEKCTHMFLHWGYCSADNPDKKENIDCCKARGAPEQCMRFCESDAPTRPEFEINQLACAPVGSMMLQCHAENLPRESTWDNDYTVFPEQDPFLPWQKNVLRNIHRQLKCDSLKRK